MLGCCLRSCGCPGRLVARFGPGSSLFRPNNDLDATIELLFFNRVISRDNQSSFAVTLSLDSVRLNAHIFDQPCFHGFSSALAEAHVVFITAKRVSVAFDLENSLRVALDESAQFL